MRGVADVSTAELAHPDRTLPAHIGRLLGGLAWPSGRGSAAPAAQAASGLRPRLQLGMAINRFAGPCMSTASAARPVLTELLARFVRHHLPQVPFCSLAVAHSSESGAHEDPNVGKTALIAIGRFTGGRFWTYDAASHEIATHAVKNKFVIFNAREPHGTCAFRGGPRFTITAYVHLQARRASADLLGQLRDLGFRPPVGGPAQALAGKPLGTRAARLCRARAAWRHYCGRRKGQKCVTQPGRARGEHRASVWKCRWCEATGVQHAGRPRKICRRKECELQDKRARCAQALLG